MAHSPDPPLVAGELPTREGYDRWSADYDHDENPLVAMEEPEVDRLLGPVDGLDVADVGCGTGRHAVRLAAAGARVTAIDFSAGMLQGARAKPGAEAVSFVTHDLQAPPLPLESASFDRVLNCLVLDHIASLQTLFGEMRRIVRPSGRIVVSVMHPAMNLRGSQARFVDPETGGRIHVESQYHVVSDYVRAALAAELAIEHISEHAVPDAIAERYPRAAKYRGWPMLLMLALKESAQGV
jgi:malonyl-CoA O-methyltransferase